ncbi:MAG: hypothetical protein ACFCBU_13440 [Cyanophyceae cyanobacterium]
MIGLAGIELAGDWASKFSESIGKRRTTKNGVAGSSYEPITESHETSFGTLRKHVPIQQRSTNILNKYF